MSLNQSKTPTSKVPIFASSEYLSWCFEASQPGSPLAQVSSAATLLVSKVATKIDKALTSNTILPGFGFSRNVQQVQNIFDAESLLMCWLYYSRYTLVILAANSNNSIAVEQSIYCVSHFDINTISKCDHIKSAFVAKLVKPTWLMDSSKSLRLLLLHWSPCPTSHVPLPPWHTPTADVPGYA